MLNFRRFDQSEFDFRMPHCSLDYNEFFTLFLSINETGYREIVPEGGGNEIQSAPGRRELMETPDMYIFLESSDRALSRKYHISYAPVTQLGAPGGRSLRLSDSEYQFRSKWEDSFISAGSEAFAMFLRTLEIVFDHYFQIWSNLVESLRGFSWLGYISGSDRRRAISHCQHRCSIVFLLHFCLVYH